MTFESLHRRKGKMKRLRAEVAFPKKPEAETGWETRYWKILAEHLNHFCRITQVLATVSIVEQQYYLIEQPCNNVSMGQWHDRLLLGLRYCKADLHILGELFVNFTEVETEII